MPEPATLPTNSKTLRLTEIYKSVQGESTWAGLPCTFVRLARCNLRCVWCDTTYAFYGGENVPIETIVAKCREFDCPLVEITGGEPLVQPACIDLSRALLDAGLTVLIETSGSLPIDTLPEGVIRIMDLKCPDSGECDKNFWPNLEALNAKDEVKFVLASRRDYEWARGITRSHNLSKRVRAVLFSPVFGSIEPAAIVRWVLEDKLDVRFQLQLHKFVWPAEARGV